MKHNLQIGDIVIFKLKPRKTETGEVVGFPTSETVRVAYLTRTPQGRSVHGVGIFSALDVNLVKRGHDSTLPEIEA